MSGEYWQKIVQARNQRQILEFEQAQLQKPATQEQIWYGPIALDLVQKIFEDIRKNAPEIQKEPFSRVRRLNDEEYKDNHYRQGIVLEWGIKLEPTTQEKELMQKYGLAIKGQKKPSFVPDKILLFDGYSMSTLLGEYHDTSASSRDQYIKSPGRYYWEFASDFFRNPDSCLKGIEEGFTFACERRYQVYSNPLWSSAVSSSYSSDAASPPF